MTIVNGSRKKACPITSMVSRIRLGSRLFTMSMRICSLSSNVHDAPTRKMMLNKTHWSSSQELDETPNTLRMTALMAETRTATSTSQLSVRPTERLAASMARLKFRRTFKSRPPHAPRCVETRRDRFLCGAADCDFYFVDLLVKLNPDFAQGVNGNFV